MMLTFCKSQLKNLLVNYSNNLQVNVSSFNSLRERDWEALNSLFDRDDSDEIEDEIKRMFEKWYSVIFITLLPPFPLVKGGNNKNPVPSPLQGEG